MWLMLEISRDLLLILKTFILSFAAELFKNLWRFLVPTYKDLSNDVILITGAGAGIGRLMCLEFAQYCPTLIGLDVNKDTLNETARAVARLGGPVLRTYRDAVTSRSRDDINQTVARVLREVGRVTILVNNAGVVSGKQILDLKPVDIDDTFQVNVISHIYMLQALLPSMMGSDGRVGDVVGSSDSVPRGHIVTIASLASVIPNPGLADYCASKAAALMLSDALELELRVANLEKHIHVTRVCPFFINTQMFEGCSSSNQPQFISSEASLLPSDGHTHCVIRFKVKQTPWKSQVPGAHCNLSCMALLIDSDILPPSDGCTLLFRSRLSWLFPVVDADYCVRQIVKAVRANERLVFIHRWQFLVAVLYWIVPRNTIYRLFDLCGTSQFVSQLQEHRKSKQEGTTSALPSAQLPPSE
ncbi:oxidoreductase, short chain dehydrogenase/reductase family protein [Opisthorchis viverrini]|uniref:Oxidoreductase, short chain dehydrogenase/reductase family protein n=1 Tax=Opisthorchis viverrini TaxID=6198 RepID=A0A1S8WKB2_OPIVI|nr:oxidoreductase, short chain dehydrogenase/reductase family protein [Opisthorchis viverrini]